MVTISSLLSLSLFTLTSNNHLCIVLHRVIHTKNTNTHFFYTIHFSIWTSRWLTESMDADYFFAAIFLSIFFCWLWMTIDCWFFLMIFFWIIFFYIYTLTAEPEACHLCDWLYFFCYECNWCRDCPPLTNLLHFLFYTQKQTEHKLNAQRTSSSLTEH
jgi:hypothetical protein